MQSYRPNYEHKVSYVHFLFGFFFHKPWSCPKSCHSSEIPTSEKCCERNLLNPGYRNLQKMFPSAFFSEMEYFLHTFRSPTHADNEDSLLSHRYLFMFDFIHCKHICLSSLPSHREITMSPVMQYDICYTVLYPVTY